MTDKNIQLLDKDGNYCYPKTKGSVVINNNNQNLGGVEANAQVNVLEGVQVNGTDLTPTNKKVNVLVPEYDMVKQSTADSGYAATYYLTKGGVQ